MYITSFSSEVLIPCLCAVGIAVVQQISHLAAHKLCFGLFNYIFTRSTTSISAPHSFICLAAIDAVLDGGHYCRSSTRNCFIISAHATYIISSVKIGVNYANILYDAATISEEAYIVYTRIIEIQSADGISFSIKCTSVFISVV